MVSLHVGAQHVLHQRLLRLAHPQWVTLSVLDQVVHLVAAPLVKANLADLTVQTLEHILPTDDADGHGEVGFADLGKQKLTKHY